VSCKYKLHSWHVHVTTNLLHPRRGGRDLLLGGLCVCREARAINAWRRALDGQAHPWRGYFQCSDSDGMLLLLCEPTQRPPQPDASTHAVAMRLPREQLIYAIYGCSPWCPIQFEERERSQEAMPVSQRVRSQICSTAYQKENSLLEPHDGMKICPRCPTQRSRNGANGDILMCYCFW